MGWLSAIRIQFSIECQTVSPTFLPASSEAAIAGVAKKFWEGREADGNDKVAGWNAGIAAKQFLAPRAGLVALSPPRKFSQ